MASVLGVHTALASTRGEIQQISNMENQQHKVCETYENSECHTEMEEQDNRKETQRI